MQWEKGNTMPEKLKYLFVADYKDGSRFTQNDGDVSSVDPLRSSFYDVLNGHGCPPISEMARFSLSGDGHTYSVSLVDGTYTDDLRECPLPGESFEKDPTEPYQIVYYRLRRHHKITPATYYDPMGSRTLPDGCLEVTNALGRVDLYPPTAEIHQGTGTNPVTHLEARMFQVWPTTVEREVFFVIGWQTNDVQGRKQERTIKLA
jgi:hypothetical protein